MADEVGAVRVSFVSSHATGGGSERYLQLLLGGLGRDWIAGVVSLQDGPLVDRLRELGYEVDVVPTPARLGMLPAARRLRRVLAAQRPDVIHANGVKAALMVVLATAGRRVPVLWLKHDFSRDGALAWFLGAFVTRVVAVSGAITATFPRPLKRKVSVVPNGVPELDVDRDAGRNAVRELAGVSGEDERVVVLVGRLDPGKGGLELIEAAPTVLAREPRARFVFLGGDDPIHPDHRQRLAERARALGVIEAVVFAGHRSDAPSLVAGADVMVLPSVRDDQGFGREACPFALIEAMTVGTPVVAYGDGGIPEMLDGAGVLVPPGDRRALGEGVADVLADRELAGRLASGARSRAQESFTLDRMVEAMKASYRALARR